MEAAGGSRSRPPESQGIHPRRGVTSPPRPHHPSPPHRAVPAFCSCSFPSSLPRNEEHGSHHPSLLWSIPGACAFRSTSTQTAACRCGSFRLEPSAPGKALLPPSCSSPPDPSWPACADGTHQRPVLTGTVCGFRHAHSPPTTGTQSSPFALQARRGPLLPDPQGPRALFLSPAFGPFQKVIRIESLRTQPPPTPESQLLSFSNRHSRCAHTVHGSSTHSFSSCRVLCFPVCSSRSLLKGFLTASSFYLP